MMSEVRGEVSAVKAIVTFAEVQGVVTNNHMAVHNDL